jgi:hypothetical protein
LGLHELFNEMAKCKRDDLGVKLLIVGDGEALEELQRERAELGRPTRRLPENSRIK